MPLSIATTVSKVTGSAGAEEIDAKGRIVTPGFVDIRTHYDGQAGLGRAHGAVVLAHPVECARATLTFIERRSARA